MRFVLFDADEGGAQHCQRDYLTHAAEVMADWLVDKLEPKQTR